MAIMSGGRAPYTTTHCVVAVYEKHRQVGLRTISIEMMPRIGISESLAGRTVQALFLLGFYDEEDGQVTPTFDALRKMSENEARAHLAALLREAYAEVLKYVDPATATLEEIERQFRVFEPTGQVPRMVQLFIGLFTYVGIREPTDNAPRANARGYRVRRMNTNTARSIVTGKRTGTETREPSVENHTSTPATPPGSNAAPDSGEDVVIDLGDAGKVTINVKVRWLSLPDDTFDKLRQGIRALQALSLPATAPSRTGAINGKPTEERAS